MLAFEHAVALGVDAIECDVHLSKDGQFVVIHDATVDRTTNATGPVAGFTAEALAGPGGHHAQTDTRQNFAHDPAIASGHLARFGSLHRDPRELHAVLGLAALFGFSARIRMRFERRARARLQDGALFGEALDIHA